MRAFCGGERPPTISMVDAPSGASLARGRGDAVCVVGGWGGTSHGALVARSLRAARFARGPRGRGATRPYPRTPTRGKLSLQAFARCARVLRFAQVFLCSRTERPACVVLAHGATCRVRAVCALPPRRSLCSRSPGARGYAPLPPDPYPRQAELAGFCALPRACCASRRCFCARARSNPHVCAGACRLPPVWDLFRSVLSWLI